MGIRGIDELVAVLPPAAAGPARAVAQGLADLSCLRHAALAPEDVRALGELWERFTAQVGSGRLAVLAVIDARDDVIPKARVGDAGAVFASHALGQRRGTARRDAAWAGLLRPEVGDLPAVGAAFAAGDVSAAHVEVAVRTHQALGAPVRERLMDRVLPDDDQPDTGRPDHDRPDGGRPDSDQPDAGGDELTGRLRAALAGLSDAFTTGVRLIRVVDVVLAHYARTFTVPELEAIARRIVQILNPPDPKGAHERRFLFMSPLPNGEWRGRFSCGAEQGLRLKRALAAWSEPRPGTAIDQDGVEHQIPDTRDLGARQMDAVLDIVNVALAKTGITLHTPPTDPSAARPKPSPSAAGDRGQFKQFKQAGGPEDPQADVDRSSPEHSSLDLDEQSDESSEQPDGSSGQSEESDESGETLEEPPAGEGEMVVLREPGVLAAPYPSVDLVVVAGIEHVAAAWAHRPHGLPVDLDGTFNAWLRDRLGHRLRPRDETEQEPAGNRPADEQPAEERPGSEELSREQQREQSPRRPTGGKPGEGSEERRARERRAREQPANQEAAGQAPPGESARADDDENATGTCDRDRDCGRDHQQREREESRLGWLGRALSPYAVPARVEHAGPVDATTLELLACNATIRAALLAPNGALLDLGRTQRLASPAQKTALLARDGGCIVPGCVVPGDGCDAHHVQWWTRGGPTDLNNLTLACGRHHTEIHQGTWQIQMHDGIAWVIPPSWIDPTRRPLRNAAHHPRARGEAA